MKTDKTQLKDGDKIETEQGTYFVELCRCGEKLILPAKACGLRCPRCQKEIPCSN